MKIKSWVDLAVRVRACGCGCRWLAATNKGSQRWNV